MRFALLLVLFALPQEDVEALIRQLGDESIEVRERANGALLKIGEKARAALEKAAASGTPEVKTRAGSILKTLDRVRQDRAWVVPATPISLSGEMTLKEAVESIEKQGGRRVECASWPDGKFKVDLKGMTYWKALEEVCRASGKRSLVCDAAGAKLVGERHVALASAVEGIFRLQSNGVAERRTMNLDTGKEEKSFSIRLLLGYENSKPPFRVYVSLESAKDDLGNDLVEGFRKNLRFAPKYEQIFSPAGKPLFALTLELKTDYEVDPKAARIAQLTGSVTAYFRASEENLRVPKAEGWIPVLEVIEDGKTEPVVGQSLFGIVRREGNDLKTKVGFRSLDSRLVAQFGDLWTIRGDGDQAATGSFDAASELDPMAPELWLAFRNADAVTGANALEVAIPRKLIRKEIPFELKDIRIR